MKIPLTFKITAFLILMILLYSIYVINFDGVIVNKIIKFNNQLSLETDKTEYHLGDVIKVQLDYCKYRNVMGKASWQLVDGFGLSFSTRSAAATVGCHKLFVPVGMIPDFVPVSDVAEYHIEGVTTYKLNGLNTVTYQLKSQSFAIVK